jgi:L-ascorbate metabolism protein UlaG (beta-lactamase superfamily)
MRRVACLLILGVAVFAQSKQPADEFPTKAGPLKITPVRHASLMIEAGGQVIHVDPAGQANYAALPKADIILLTDIHGDHLDPNVLPTVRKPSTMIIGPEAVAQKLQGVTVMRSGETKTVGQWTFEAIPMYNEKRGPAPGRVFHEKGRGNGYVVTYGGLRVYIAGDTENIPEMRALKNIDVAFIPMNLPYTMPPEEAAEAVKAFHPKVVYPYHYRGSDINVFKKALEGTGIDVRLRDWYS